MAQYRIVHDTDKGHDVALITPLKSKEVPVEYSPTYYTPEETDSEGVDKVSAFFKGLDKKIGQITAGAVIFEDFDVLAGGQTEFQLISNITESQVIEVEIDGRKQREGGSHAWARNHTLNRVIFNDVVAEDSWVHVIIHGSTFNIFEYDVSNPAGQAAFSVPGLVTDSILVVFVDGRTQREGTAFNRSTGQIDFTEAVPQDSWVLVHVR